MKIKSLGLMALVLTALTFTACSDDDEPTNENITGTWIIEEASDHDGDYIDAAEADIPYWTFTFNANGTFTTSIETWRSQYTWKLNDKTITVYANSNNVSLVVCKFDILELKDKTFKAKFLLDPDNQLGYSDIVYLKCKRI